MATEALAAYLALRQTHPHWFSTPVGGVEIISDPSEIRAAEAEMAARYAKRGWPKEWTEVGVRYADPYLMVLRDAVVFPDGGIGIHHRCVRMQEEPAGAAVLPLLGDKILLLRHFRHPTRQFHWEAPRGAIELGRSIEETVRAELSEEIEGVVADVTPMGLLHGASGFMRLSVVLCAARIEGFGAPALGEGIVDAKLFSVAEVENMIRRSDITDSFTLAAFLHARLRGMI